MRKRIFCALSVCGISFTAIVTVMALIVAALEEKGQALGLTPEKILLFLAFSATVGAASLLITGKKTGTFKYILHFALCFGAFLLFVMIGNGLSIKNMFFLLLLVGFGIVYALVMALRHLLRRSATATNNRKTDPDKGSDKEYTSIFKKD